MPEEKDGYKMRMIVPKPTDPEELKKREELSKRLKDYPNEELKRALEGIQAKKEQEERERKEEEERKTRETPKEIKDFRKKWEEEINLDDETKNKIIEVTNRIALKIEIEPDGSRRIEMTIGGKEYEILDVNTKTHTDDEYGVSYSYGWVEKDEVNLGGMIGDNVDNRTNQKLKEYVKKKERKGFHIPKIEEMRSLLNELGKEAGIAEIYQVAMLMYLTGMYGYYWLSMGDEGKSDSQADSRSVMLCKKVIRGFFDFSLSTLAVSLCMIANS